jgi:hypothetical protein
MSAALTGLAKAAGEAGDLDVTIRVIDSKQGIDDFINRIELPKGVAETVPATPARTQEPAGNISEKGRQVDDDTPGKRRDTGKNRDERRDKGNHERKDNGQSDSQRDSSDPDRSWISEHRQRDSSDYTKRETDSRERRENLQSHSREQRESARE